MPEGGYHDQSKANTRDDGSSANCPCATQTYGDGIPCESEDRHCRREGRVPGSGCALAGVEDFAQVNSGPVGDRAFR